MQISNIGMAVEIFGPEDISWTRWKNEKMIADYIKNQLEEDFAKDQISLKEFADPFTGERNK